MSMQEGVRAFTVDGVRPVVPFDFCCLGGTEHCVAAAHFGKLPRNPVVEPNTIVVTSFYHERTRSDAHGHFAIVEAATS